MCKYVFLLHVNVCTSLYINVGIYYLLYSRVHIFRIYLSFNRTCLLSFEHSFCVHMGNLNNGDANESVIC